MSNNTNQTNSQKDREIYLQVASEYFKKQIDGTVILAEKEIMKICELVRADEQSKTVSTIKNTISVKEMPGDYICFKGFNDNTVRVKNEQLFEYLQHHGFSLVKKTEMGNDAILVLKYMQENNIRIVDNYEDNGVDLGTCIVKYWGKNNETILTEYELVTSVEFQDWKSKQVNK